MRALDILSALTLAAGFGAAFALGSAWPLLPALVLAVLTIGR